VAPTPTHPLAVVASIGDPDGTRTITAIVALLVVLGVGLVMLAVWLFRTTRPDPELLAPLDVMGERKWRRADPVWQRRKLDQVRPAGARPLQPSVAPPELDAAFDLGPVASGFDDLHEPVHHEPDPDGGPDDADLPDAHDGATTGVDEGDDGDDGDLDETDEQTHGDVAPDEVMAGEPLAWPQAAATPTGIVRPTSDDFSDHEIDPALVESAMRQLEEELAPRRQRVEGDDQH
jgi:hypothetical protein